MKLIINHFPIDLTYLLEKFKLKQIKKILYNKGSVVKVQEGMLYKYLTFTSNSKLNVSTLPKFNCIFNLHKYIFYKFPLFKDNLKLNNTILNLELNNQRNYTKKKKLKIITQQLNCTDSFSGIKSIEHIFEMFYSKKSYLISPSVNILLYLYKYSSIFIVEIPTQNLLSNLNIILLSTNSQYNLKYLKTSNSLSVGGEVITSGFFSPNLLIKYFNHSMLNVTTMYKSSQNTIIYIYNIILESLVKQYKYQGIILPSFLFEIIIKKMISYVKVYYPGDTSLPYNSIVSLNLINLLNQSFIKHGLIIALYTPYLVGISKISSGYSGIISSISFQETLKLLSKLVLTNNLDWLLDLKTKIITSELLNTGTGWYKHYNIII